MQGLSKFYEYPLLSQERTCKATNVKFGRYIQSVHTNKSRLKIWEKLERGRVEGLPKFFEYPLLSQERVKLRTSNFVRTFLVSIGTLQISRKVAGCVVRTLETFQGTHILGASRGLLCDSSAVLFKVAFITQHRFNNLSIIVNHVQSVMFAITFSTSSQFS